ncbi:MAG TPA: hypothetical protein DCZ10_15890 [Pelotomaculum sp.]|nr:hypothetical protein [Pelotomaculum sp.]
MKLYAFPTDNDRARIHSLIQLNACGRISRMRADIAITQIMDKYGISALRVNDYTIKVGEPIKTIMGSFQVTHIKTSRTAHGDRCPDCGGKPGYLEGDAEITAGCQNCGAVFKFSYKEEVN